MVEDRQRSTFISLSCRPGDSREDLELFSREVLKRLLEREGGHTLGPFCMVTKSSAYSNNLQRTPKAREFSTV